MYKLKNKKLGKAKGITLIALVITIIILLILAGVSIAMLTGPNGLLTQANEAKEKTEKATEDEQRQIAMLEAATNTKNTKFQEITIPAGFAPTRIEGESTVDEGLVIIDSEGNEFVWVPVTGYKKEGNTNEYGLYEEFENKFKSKNTSDVDYMEYYKNNEWEKTEYYNMMLSVQNNGGFYIGRYEAGSMEARTKNVANGTDKVVIKRDAFPYNMVAWGASMTDIDTNITMGDKDQGKGAVYLSKHLYDGKDVGVVSTLCYGNQWEATLNFAMPNLESNIDWERFGNYRNSSFKLKRLTAWFTDGGDDLPWTPMSEVKERDKFEEDSLLLTCGSFEEFKNKNIYDLAGNCSEWTMECYGLGCRVYRDQCWWSYGETEAENDSRR